MPMSQEAVEKNIWSIQAYSEETRALQRSVEERMHLAENLVQTQAGTIATLQGQIGTLLGRLGGGATSGT